MANTTVYPYGTGGSLPSSIGLINDLTTGGVDKALTAEQGKVLNEKIFIRDVPFWQNSSSANWITGNIHNGAIDTYANQYIIISGFPEGVTKVKITRTASDSTYALSVWLSADGVSFSGATGFPAGESGTNTYTLGSNNRIGLNLWTKPTQARARQEQILITYESEADVLTTADVVDNLNSQSATLPLSANQGRILGEKTDDILFNAISGTYQLTWNTGNIRTSGTGASGIGSIDTNYANKYTDFVELSYDEFYVDNQTSSYTVNIFYYDAGDGCLGKADRVYPGITGKKVAPDGTTKIRLCAWDEPSDTDVLSISMGYSFDSIKSLRESIDELSAGSYYSNPVLSVDAPDPCIVDGQDGYFYMLGTGQLASRTMFRSPNLVDWEEADRPFTDQAIADCYADLGVSSVGFWAPEIVKVGDKYNLYCSKGATPMMVFQSDHPTFGYEYKGQIITTSNGLASDNIDACVRYDLDGTLWIFWGSTYRIYRQKLSANGLTLDANDTRVHVAGKLVSQDSSRATVFEGAYLYRRKGYWYLFVSAGKYGDYTYCLKVGRSATLTGTFVDKDGNNMTDGYGTTILSSANGDALYGPGHNGQIITDRKNRTYMVYHSHYTGASTTSQRYICLQEILWDENGWPYFGYMNGKPQQYQNEAPSF